MVVVCLVEKGVIVALGFVVTIHRDFVLVVLGSFAGRTISLRGKFKFSALAFVVGHVFCRLG